MSLLVNSFCRCDTDRVSLDKTQAVAFLQRASLTPTAVAQRQRVCRTPFFSVNQLCEWWLGINDAAVVINAVVLAMVAVAVVGAAAAAVAFAAANGEPHADRRLQKGVGSAGQYSAA